MERQFSHTSALHQDFTAPNFSLSLTSGSVTDQDLNGLDDAIDNSLFTTTAPTTPINSFLLLVFRIIPFPLQFQPSCRLEKEQAWDIETLCASFLCCSNGVEYNSAGLSRFSDPHPTGLIQNRRDALAAHIPPERSCNQQYFMILLVVQICC